MAILIESEDYTEVKQLLKEQSISFAEGTLEELILKDAVNTFVETENRQLDDIQYTDSFKSKLYNEVYNSSEYRNLDEALEEVIEVVFNDLTQN